SRRPGAPLATPELVRDRRPPPLRDPPGVGRTLVPRRRRARLPRHPPPPERHGLLPALPGVDERVTDARPVELDLRAPACKPGPARRARRRPRARGDVVARGRGTPGGRLRRAPADRLRLLDGVPGEPRARGDGGRPSGRRPP